MTQMWLIPADTEDVEKIYNAMVQCQILNPDPNDSLSEDGKILFDEIFRQSNTTTTVGRMRDVRNLKI